jgi:hypothetical protein
MVHGFLESVGQLSVSTQALQQIVMALLDEMGFDALDAGPLSESWRYQLGTPAHCPDPTIQQLRKLLQRAKRDKALGNRDQAAKNHGKTGS